MKKDAYSVLEQIVEDAFHNTYAGLHTMLRSSKRFVKTIEQKARIGFFNEFHEFFMTQNEKQFHLMGFIDAIIWLECSGYFNNHDDAEEEAAEAWVPETEDEKMISAQAEKERKAIFSVIASFETGEDW